MRTVLLLLSLSFAMAQAPKTIEISFKAHDGLPMFGKLTVPAGSGRYPVVIYVQTAEGATVDTRRLLGGGRTFNYYDLYREKLPPMNVAFFSYEGRGIRMGDAPPRFEQIDRDVYNTSTLENKVRDVLSAIDVVRGQENVDSSRIILMGTSEGTLLAADAAARRSDDVRGVILYAVVSSTLKDALHYMAADGAFLTMRQLFDAGGDGSISKQEFTADPRKLRAAGLAEVPFEQLDASGDGSFTADDFRQLRKALLDAIDSGQVEPIYAWLKLTAAVSIPDKWLEDHFAHPPMWTFLSRLTVPVGLFHGLADQLTPAAGTKALEERARQAGKANLEFHYFEGLDHSLGLGPYFAGAGDLPAGHKAIFDYIQKNWGR